MWSETIVLFIFGLCIAIIGYLITNKIETLENELGELKKRDDSLATDIMTEEKVLFELQCTVNILRTQVKDLVVWAQKIDEDRRGQGEGNGLP